MFIEDLKAEIDAYAARLMGEARLWKLAERGAVTPNVVASYLYNLFFVLSFTEPHLTLAGARATELGRHALSRSFAEKLPEESGHAAWADEDLARLRADFGAEYRLEPHPAMVRLMDAIEAALVQNPATYLGYTTFAEYFTVIAGPAWMGMLSERCGIPVSTLSAVSRHIELDVEHAARGFDELACLVRESDEAAVMSIVRLAMKCLAELYDGLADQAASELRSRELIHAA